MKFFAVAALFAGALAMPTAEIEARTDHDGGHGGHGGSGYQPCSTGIQSNPYCVDTDVLGLVCINAVTPNRVPTSAKDFKKICSEVGKTPRCVVIGILDQAVLCRAPVGISS